MRYIIWKITQWRNFHILFQYIVNKFLYMKSGDSFLIVYQRIVYELLSEIKWSYQYLILFGWDGFSLAEKGDIGLRMLQFGWEGFLLTKKVSIWLRRFPYDWEGFHLVAKISICLRRLSIGWEDFQVAEKGFIWLRRFQFFLDFNLADKIQMWLIRFHPAERCLLLFGGDCRAKWLVEIWLGNYMQIKR